MDNLLARLTLPKLAVQVNRRRLKCVDICFLTSNSFPIVRVIFSPQCPHARPPSSHVYPIEMN